MERNLSSQFGSRRIRGAAAASVFFAFCFFERDWHIGWLIDAERATPLPYHFASGPHVQASPRRWLWTFSIKNILLFSYRLDFEYWLYHYALLNKTNKTRSHLHIFWRCLCWYQVVICHTYKLLQKKIRFHTHK